jgi:hypothetical protein
MKTKTFISLPVKENIIDIPNLAEQALPEDTLLQAVSDLYIRDIEKLLFVNKDYKKAGWVMSAIGMPKNIINKCIKEAKEVN